MRDTQSPTQQSAVPQPGMPHKAQPAVLQPALPQDRQVGPSVGGSHTSVRSTHNPTMQKGSHSLAKPSLDLTARSTRVKSSQKPHSQGKKSSKERVEIIPSFIPTQALTPKTKVLLDQSGPVGNRCGVVWPATKPAGDWPQHLSSTKWWWPPSFSGKRA